MYELIRAMSDDHYSLTNALQHLEHIAQMKTETLKSNANKAYMVLNELMEGRELSLRIFHAGDMVALKGLIETKMKLYGKYKATYDKVTDYLNELEEQARYLSGEIGPYRFVGEYDRVSTPLSFVLTYIESVELICSVDKNPGLAEGLRKMTLAFTDILKGSVRHGILSLKAIEPGLMKLVEGVVLKISKEDDLNAAYIKVFAPAHATHAIHTNKKMTRKIRK